MLKRELRKTYSSKRKLLSDGECALLNQGIYANFFGLVDLTAIRTLHMYLPIPKNNEPDTWQILDRIRREYAHIKITLPKTDVTTYTIENIYFEGLHQLKANAWDIPEPQQGVPTPVETIDMALVPLLAVDKQGHRAGYGKGFYDRFLKQCRPDCKKVGLSFFEPVDVIDDVDAFDVPLTHCVTPSKLHIFSII